MYRDRNRFYATFMLMQSMRMFAPHEKMFLYDRNDSVCAISIGEVHLTPRLTCTAVIVDRHMRTGAFGKERSIELCAIIHLIIDAFRTCTQQDTSVITLCGLDLAG